MTTTEILPRKFVLRAPMAKKTSQRKFLTREEMVQGLLKEHGQEYGQFLLIQMGYLPPICPNCQNKSFTTLWLADPRHPIDGTLWAKFYFWCEECHTGIRCPLGRWRIPRTTPHILYGDEQALKAALPPDIKLIRSPRLPAPIT